MKQPILCQNEILSNRTYGIYKTLLYLEDKSYLKPKKAQACTKEMLSKNEKLRQTTAIMPLLLRTRFFFLEDVLLNRQKWSKNKYDEVMFFAADLLEYIIEDITIK